MRSLNLGIAALCGTVLLFAAAGASAQVVDGNYLVTDDADSGFQAAVTADGTTYLVDVDAICVSGGDTVGFEGTSDHPDSVKVDARKAAVKQSRRENPIDIEVVATGTLDFTGTIENCDSTKIEGEVDDSRGTGKFKLEAKNCTTDLSDTQINYLADTCASERNIKGNYDPSGQTVKSLKISGKGTAAGPL